MSTDAPPSDAGQLTACVYAPALRSGPPPADHAADEPRAEEEADDVGGDAEGGGGARGHGAGHAAGGGGQTGAEGRERVPLRGRRGVRKRSGKQGGTATHGVVEEEVLALDVVVDVGRDLLCAISAAPRGATSHGAGAAHPTQSPDLGVEVVEALVVLRLEGVFLLSTGGGHDEGSVGTGLKVRLLTA